MLTEKQYKLLMFINKVLKETGCSPSFDEMKDAVGLKSKSGIHALITALEEREFIRKLPHNLVEAFKSTLEEAKYADYIIHVVDCSNPQAVQQMEVVYDTLQELGVQGKKTITLFNKVDVGAAIRMRDSMADHTLKVSAKTGEGLEDLKQLLGKILSEEQIYVEKLFGYQEAGKIQLIREYGQLLSEEYTDSGIMVKARVPQEIHGKIM